MSIKTIKTINATSGAIKSATLGELKVLSLNLAKNKAEKEIERAEIHHVLVYDRSGSMYGDLSRLVEDIHTSVMSLPKEDAVTVFWYSGSKQSGIVISGKVKTITDEDLRAALKGASTTVGLTVFSDTLIAIQKLVKSNPMPIAISWFTDGQLCPNSTTREEERRLVMRSVRELSTEKTVLGINTIGYGNYYDKALLVDMTSSFSLGSFNHANQVTDFGDIFKEFSGDTSSSSGYVGIEVVSTAGDSVYLMSDSSVKRLVPTISRESHDSYVIDYLPKTGTRLISKSELSISVSGDFTLNVKTQKTTPASQIKYSYGLAALQYVEGNRENALDIVENELGDLRLFNLMMTSYAISEIGETFSEMMKAYKNAKKREFNTITFTNLPKTDLFTILSDLKSMDAELLMNGVIKEYTRVGRKTSENDSDTDDEKVKFTETVGVPLLTNTSSISFSKTQFSITATNVVVPGTINLKSEDRLLFPEAVGGNLPVNRIKSYSIIKDGKVNVNFLDVYVENKIERTKLLSGLVKDEVKAELVMMNFSNAQYEVVRIYLAGIPLASRILSRAYSTFSELTSTIKEDVESKFAKKAARYLIDLVKEDSRAVVKDNNLAKKYTALQLQTLKENYATTIYSYGLTYQGFTRPSVSEGDHDSFMTRFMDFGMKGMSSIPKVEESINYVPTKKPSLAKVMLKELTHDIISRVKDKTGVDISVKIEKHTKVIEELNNILHLLNRNSDLLEQVKFIKGVTAGFFSDLELPENLEKKTYEVETKEGVFTLTASYRTEYID